MLKPNLDRFSQPGPYERRGVKSLLEIDTCEVCGHEMHPSLLRSWNGKDVCRFCIEELMEEVEDD